MIKLAYDKTIPGGEPPFPLLLSLIHPVRFPSRSSKEWSHHAMADSDCRWKCECSFHALSPFLSWKATHVGLRATVERGPSEGMRSGSKGPTWVAFQESPISHTSLKRSGRGCPLLRASDEHSFIVCVLRARRAPGPLLPISTTAASTACQSATRRCTV
jgi:hypothetical protein